MDFKISIFNLLIDKYENLLTLNILCMIPFLYLLISCLYALFSLRINKIYEVYFNKNTDSFSLIFLTSFMCRIVFPLCLNFVQLLKITKGTTLEDFIGVTNIVPIFGNSFYKFYPAILLFLCVLHYFDMLSFTLKCFGYQHIWYQGNGNKEEDLKIEEGKQLLKQSKIILFIIL